MDAQVAGETGFRNSGIVYLCETRRELDAYEAWLEQARQFQVQSRLLGPAEVDQVFPGSARRWAGALITPTDGRAEPGLAARRWRRARAGRGPRF